MLNKIFKKINELKEEIDISSIKENIKNINLKDILEEKKEEIKDISKNLLNEEQRRIIIESLDLRKPFKENFAETFNHFYEGFKDEIEEDTREKLFNANIDINYGIDLFEHLDKLFNKKDVFILKKCYLQNNFEEFKNLNFKDIDLKTNLIDKIPNIKLKNNKPFSYSNLYFLFKEMENFLNENELLNEDTNNRDISFFAAVEKFTKEVCFEERLFEIKDRFENKESLNSLIEELKIFPEDIEMIFFDSEIINRKSEFFLISHSLEHKLELMNERILVKGS